MISRRQIIESHQELNDECELFGGESDESRPSFEGEEEEEENEFEPPVTVATSATNENSIIMKRINNNNQQDKTRDLVAEMKKKQQVVSNSSHGQRTNALKSAAQQQQKIDRSALDHDHDSSGKYKFFKKQHEQEDDERYSHELDDEEVEEDSSGMGSGENQLQAARIGNNQLQQHHHHHQMLNQHQPDYRHFDPYSVYGEEDEEEDVWYSEERLFEDHLQEVADKWMAIDDEIWAKIICMERNRRIAKAYARKHSLTVNGSEDKYLDGTTLGLNSFENPDRDTKTRRVKQYIGHGLRISITQSGDIVVKRLSKADVFVHQSSSRNVSCESQGNRTDQRLRGSNSSSDVYALNSESGECYGVVGHPLDGLKSQRRNNQSDKVTVSSTSSSSDSSAWPTSFIGANRTQNNVVASGPNKYRSASKKQQQQQTMNGGAALLSQSSSNVSQTSGYTSCALELNRPMKIFDMNEFKSLLECESRRPTPNRRFMQSQCISVISFVVDDRKMLNLPSWIMIINIVAIDLLKTELGLMDPHDLYGPLAEPPACVTANGFGTDMLDIEGRSMEDDAGSPNGSKTQRFAASKKAFANAAASGAYNGDRFKSKVVANQNQSNWAYGIHRTPNLSFPTALPIKKKKEIRAIKAGSDGQLNKPGATKKQHLSGKEEVNQKPQQSSSSSGFNSNCSSQNDSSAASSSSNIAAPAEAPEKPAYRGVANLVGVFKKKTQAASASGDKEPIKRKATKSPAITSSTDNLLAKKGSELGPRGKRPPKLPHRVVPSMAANTSGSLDQLPTDSKKQANLILVSPTGLSPPLPKRKVKPIQRHGGSQTVLDVDKMTSSNDYGEEEDSSVPEFSTIKHIDENGKCSVLAPAPPPARLPNGIPAHAQLAPPATQRQVLRYLMSARGNLTEVNPASSSQAAMPPPSTVQQMINNPRRGPAVPTRYQRPLPILPTVQKQRPARDPGCDESLYYYGLQARVSANQQPRRQMMMPPAPPHPVITKSAINAILTDFKLNSQRQQKSSVKQQVHYVNPYLRPQFSLNNLHQQYHQSPMHICNEIYCGENCASGKDNNIYNLSRQSSSKQPTTGPVMNFFKSRASSSKQKTAMQNKAMFSSVDNLLQANSQKSSSLLGGFSGQGLLSKLKVGGSKMKKSSSKLDNEN